MKKFIYIMFGMTLLYSCNQTNTSVVEPDGKAAFLSAIASTDPLASVSEADPLKLANLAKGNANARAAARRYTEYGPFTVNATLNLSKTKEKILLTTNQSLYPPGIYFCDIYVSVAIVTLPANAIPVFVGSTITGYTENDYYSQTEGVTRSETDSGSSKTYRMVTYSMVPQIDVSGKEVNHFILPRALDNNAYTYKYLIL